MEQNGTYRWTPTGKTTDLNPKKIRNIIIAALVAILLLAVLAVEFKMLKQQASRSAVIQEDSTHE